MSWKLWGWQRFQQLVGALIVLLPTAVLFAYFVTGSLPKDFGQDIPIKEFDHRQTDHAHLAIAIGSCHLPGSPLTWPVPFLAALRLSPSALQVVNAAGKDELALRSADGTSSASIGDPPQETLTSFERAAIYHSDRIVQERNRYLEEAEQRQNRVRRNQLRILLLSATGAFLVGMTTLVTKTNEDAPFRSLTRGAMLPISALALLMPLLSTAMSGLVAFDDDARVSLRDLRTLAQLEQLHGRVAADVMGDPFRCQVVRATQALDQNKVSAMAPDIASKFGKCVMDRMQRTTAWEQRHEQILNDATQSLAQAGDLPRPGDASSPHNDKAAPTPSPGTDPCQYVFGTPQRSMSDQRPSDDQPRRG